MAILKIVKVPDKVLRKKSKKVKALTPKVRKLISDMWATLESQKDPEGVGLAAPQVGVLLRIFCMNFENTKRTVINPSILEKRTAKKRKKTKKEEEDEEVPMEGCLSLPHFYGPLERSEYIKIKYMDEKGNEKTEEFKGFIAHIVEHEIDHLNGKIFIDRILEQKSELFEFSEDGSWEEVELV